ncbi:MAG: hypothetical protein SW833_03345 [Cyanobacteriota bacterium]|nr:hypothetical protein [Cyanobacteriota bacterium]
MGSGQWAVGNGQTSANAAVERQPKLSLKWAMGKGILLATNDEGQMTKDEGIFLVLGWTGRSRKRSFPPL